VNFSRSTDLMLRAMRAGVNFFDSHHGYHGGQSETAIGKALRRWKGGRIWLQTKTPWYDEKPRAHFERLLAEALEKLGAGTIDYLLHHSLRMQTWKERGRGFIRFTDWAMKRGLIRHRGFSSHDTPQHVREFIRTGEFSVALLSYNWMNPQQRDTIAYAAERGMGVTVMNPAGGGTLAADTPQILRLLPGAGSAAQIAFRYVLATPGVTCALSGMNTAEQLDENVAVCGRRAHMTPAQARRMEGRLATIRRGSLQFCSACGYCMPCPGGVDIPANFGLMNEVKFFGLLDAARLRYARLGRHKDGDRSAAACRRCGACAPKCPLRVPIPERLSAVAATLA
jgi:predicted aldo/keto reductase-like oxidoreductase